MAHWMGPGKRLPIALTCRSANAEAVKPMLIDEEHLPPEHMSVLPNGIDLARFDRARGAPLADPLANTQGRVANTTHPVKAQEDLFEAARLLAAERPAGRRRPALPMLEGMVDEMGIRPYVSFLGKRPDVPAILARSDLGVLCSHAEGLSNAIIEGMAAGLPMVVTAAGGSTDLVRNGESGYVVPVRSPPQLAPSHLDGEPPAQAPDGRGDPHLRGVRARHGPADRPAPDAAAALVLGAGGGLSAAEPLLDHSGSSTAREAAHDRARRTRRRPDSNLSERLGRLIPAVPSAPASPGSGACRT